VNAPSSCNSAGLRSASLAFARRALIRGALAAAGAGPALAQQPAQQPWSLELEYQRYRIENNSVQRPNTSFGTRFSVPEFTGDTGNGLRLTGFAPLNWWREGDALRVVIAPLKLSGTAVPTSPINYDGATFQAGLPLTVDYKFNTYRFSYVMPVFSAARNDGWDLRLGGTIGIRDAQIKLTQGALVRDFTNVGPIPLLYVSAARALGAGWSIEGEFDGFPAPGGGGLFDGSLKAVRALTPNLALTAGVRYQIGAAVDPDIYNSLREVMLLLGVRGSF
jgi:hypothetical protein